MKNLFLLSLVQLLFIAIANAQSTAVELIDVSGGESTYSAEEVKAVYTEPKRSYFTALGRISSAPESN